jgi:hypothetical protein
MTRHCLVVVNHGQELKFEDHALEEVLYDFNEIRKFLAIKFSN